MLFYPMLLIPETRTGQVSDRAGPTHLVGVHHQHSPPVHFLHLLWCHQVGHAHRLPLGLPGPQHRVHCGEQGSDVSLFAFYPLQDLQAGNRKGLGQSSTFCLPGL